MLRFHKIIFCWFLIPILQANGQQYDFVHLKKYTQEQGLGSYNVRKVFQDSKGFLWVATQEGLDRFDGNNFVNYKRSSVAKHQLSGIDIREITEDTTNNMIWVLAAENAINAIDIQTGNVTRSFLIKQENPNEWDLSMCLAGDKLFVGSLVGVKVYDKNTGKLITRLNLPDNANKLVDVQEARCIKTDSYGNIWVSYGGYGITVYNRALKIIASIPLNQLQVPADKGIVRFNDLAFTKKNEVLLATNIGLRKIIFDRNYNFSIDNYPCKKALQLNSHISEAICSDSHGQIYIAGAKKLFKLDRNLTEYKVLQETQSETDRGWMSDVLKIYNDSEDNIWLGCEQGVAFLSKYENPFQAYYYDAASNERLEHVMSICKLESDTLLVGSRDGFAVVNPKDHSFRIYGKGYMTHHIFQDKKNHIHISRPDGMFFYENGKLMPLNLLYPEFASFITSPVNSHIFIGDSMVVLGTENNNGILLWNYLKHTVNKIDEYSKNIQLASGIVNSVFSDRQKNVWVLSDNTINIISNNFTQSVVLKLYDSSLNQNAGLFFDMCEAGGYYWIASYGTGLIQLDSMLKIKKIFNSNDGLNNDGVYQVYQSNNNLIITTNNGLSALNLKNLKFQKYYHNDGLHSNGFEEAAGTMKNGIIFAGGVKGFTVIKPELLLGNSLPPALYIDKIVLETSGGEQDSSNLFFRSYIIPNNTLQTNIYFSALNYTNPTRTTYTYRIVERSKEWIDLSGQNFVTLIGLSPGTYHLQVKAANEDGVWSEPKELELIFLPKWYQTWWFYLLIGLTVTGILYALYRYRISQIKKQHEIRKNIATDLHDDLGSTLNSVKVFTNLAISGVKQEESLQQVKDNLTEATMSLRDMIWVLDDSLDTVDELITRLKQFAIPVAAASNIEASIKADSDVNSRQLTKEEKRNLFLICKEAINNSIKYSGASRIHVEITASGKKIQIALADNGKGFNVDEVKKGYGLKNMQYRAGQIKYKAVLTSSPGNGTQITILPS